MVHWTGRTRPSVAGFFHVQVWFLNIAASPLREGYQLPLGGLLAAFHVPLPRAQTTGRRTLGAEKGGVSVQSPAVRSAEQVCSDLRTLQEAITGMGLRLVNYTHMRTQEARTPTSLLLQVRRPKA